MSFWRAIHILYYKQFENKRNSNIENVIVNISNFINKLHENFTLTHG